MQRVVIVGAGQAGFQAALSLRAEGFAGSITLVGDENRLPYQRPPLSKAYLKDDMDFERLTLRPDSYFSQNRIDLRLADPARSIDRTAGVVALRSGLRLAYDRLVLATGAGNRALALEGLAHRNVHMIRAAADAERFRDALATARRLVIVGGGFIGLEVAASARAKGLDVTVLEAAPRLMSRVVSPAVSDFFLAAHGAMGTRVHLSTGARRIVGTGLADGVESDRGDHHPADLVLVAAGVTPNDALARAAGLETENGIRVDRFMTTSDPRIFAIGDCAAFESAHAEGLVRLESVQNAVDQAKCAAARIMGRDRPYASVPWFWSDQGDCKLQIAGITSGADDVHAVGTPEDGRLIAYCFAKGRLVGVETVNRPGDHMASRKVLSTEFRVARDDVEAENFDLRAHVAAMSRT